MRGRAHRCAWALATTLGVASLASPAHAGEEEQKAQASAEAVPLLAPRRTLDERFPDGPPRAADHHKPTLRPNRRGKTVYRDPEGRFVATIHPDGRPSFRDKGLTLRNRRIMSLYDVILAAQGVELHQTAKRAFLRETYANRLAMRVEWTVGNLREAERRLWDELLEIWADESKTRLERELIIGQRWYECDVDVDLGPVDGQVSVVDAERRTVARRARLTIEHFIRVHIDPDASLGKVTPEDDAAVALAPDLFEQCERDAGACIAVGDLLVGRRANAFDPGRGAKYYARACKADDPWACYELGVLHYLGLGVKRDDRRSAELHVVACKAGVPQGCAYLEYLHRRGLGVPRSDAHASHYRQLACAKGLEDYCMPSAAAQSMVKTTASPG